MQTFLPYLDFLKTAQVLDSQRLVKQLLECRQIFSALAGQTQGWRNHPATLMWKDSPQKLYEYTQAIIDENNNRKYSTEKNAEAIENLIGFLEPGEDQPWWMNDPELVRRITRTHQASLYRKNPIFYEDFSHANPGYTEDVCCTVKGKTALGKTRGPCDYLWATHLADPVVRPIVPRITIIK